MTAEEFIKSELKTFIKLFSKTRVRYENNSESNTHFVEVVPNEIYHLDTKYIEWESDFFDNFIKHFPYENICFISDDALVGLDKIDFELKGQEFISDFSFNSPCYLNQLGIINISKFNSSFFYSNLNTFSGILSNPIHIGVSISVKEDVKMSNPNVFIFNELAVSLEPKGKYNFSQAA